MPQMAFKVLQVSNATSVSYIKNTAGCDGLNPANINFARSVLCGLNFSARIKMIRSGRLLGTALSQTR